MISTSIFKSLMVLSYICYYMLTTCSFASKNKSLINKLKSQLSDDFEMKDLGEVKKILGMEIHRDLKATKLYLSQRKYFKKVVDKGFI